MGVAELISIGRYPWIAVHQLVSRINRDAHWRQLVRDTRFRVGDLDRFEGVHLEIRLFH